MEKNALQYMFEPYKKYATFSGRARRMEFWMFNLLIVVVGVGLYSFVPSQELAETLDGLFSLVTVLPYIAVYIRRMHDIGRSGWWMLLPIVNIIFACFSGDEGKNKYGDDPISKAERKDS